MSQNEDEISALLESIPEGDDDKRYGHILAKCLASLHRIEKEYYAGNKDKTRAAVADTEEALHDLINFKPDQIN